jgi:hypothetical protein
LKLALKNHNYLAAVVVLLHLLFIYLFSRYSLILIFIPAALFLILVRFLWKRLLGRAAIGVLALLLILVALPVDVKFRNADSFSISVLPIIWGIITPKDVDCISGGCVIPIHPARIALVISF